MKNYIQQGDAVTITAAAEMKSGSLYQVGKLAGVAQSDAKVGDRVALVIEGVVALKDAALASADVGDDVFVKDGVILGEESAEAATAHRLGVVVAVEAGTVSVKLTP